MWKISHINQTFIQKLYYIRMYPKIPDKDFQYPKITDKDFQYPKIPDWIFFWQIYPIPGPNPKFLPIPEPDIPEIWKYLPAGPWCWIACSLHADLLWSFAAGTKKMGKKSTWKRGRTLAHWIRHQQGANEGKGRHGMHQKIAMMDMQGMAAFHTKRSPEIFQPSPVQRSGWDAGPSFLLLVNCFY